MWDYIAGNLLYTLPFALLYLAGMVAAAINIGRAPAAAFMVMTACFIMLMVLIAGQVFHAWVYSTQSYDSVGYKIYGYVRTITDLFTMGLLVFAAFVGRGKPRVG